MYKELNLSREVLFPLNIGSEEALVQDIQSKIDNGDVYARQPGYVRFYDDKVNEQWVVAYVVQPFDPEATGKPALEVRTKHISYEDVQRKYLNNPANVIDGFKTLVSWDFDGTWTIAHTFYLLNKALKSYLKRYPEIQESLLTANLLFPADLTYVITELSEDPQILQVVSSNCRYQRWIEASANILEVSEIISNIVCGAGNKSLFVQQQVEAAVKRDEVLDVVQVVHTDDDLELCAALQAQGVEAFHVARSKFCEEGKRAGFPSFEVEQVEEALNTNDALKALLRWCGREDILEAQELQPSDLDELKRLLNAKQAKQFQAQVRKRQGLFSLDSTALIFTDHSTGMVTAQSKEGVTVALDDELSSSASDSSIDGGDFGSGYHSSRSESFPSDAPVENIDTDDDNVFPKRAIRQIAESDSSSTSDSEKDSSNIQQQPWSQTLGASTLLSTRGAFASGAKSDGSETDEDDLLQFYLSDDDEKEPALHEKPTVVAVDLDSSSGSFGCKK